MDDLDLYELFKGFVLEWSLAWSFFNQHRQCDNEVTLKKIEISYCSFDFIQASKQL